MKQNLLILSIIAIILFAISCEAPKNSALRIKADQENAKVIIDGEEIGTVPLDVMVTSEEHLVEVILESSDTSNYYFSETVKIAENVSKSLFAKLEIRYTEQYYWDNASTLEGIEEYKKQYPKGKRIAQINEKIEDVYFEKIKNAETISDVNNHFKKYDSLYPTGKYIKDASEIIEKRYFEKIKNSKSLGTLMKSYNNYKAEFPTGKYIKDASEIIEKRYFEKIKNSKSLGTLMKSYNNYKAEFPTGKYIKDASEIIEKRYFEKIKNSKSLGTLMKSYNNYKAEFPTGKYIKDASEMIEQKYFEKIKNSKLLGTIKKNYNNYKSEFPTGKYIQKSDSIINSFSGVFTDKRDGQKYKWVKIGNQVWMAENLNYKTNNSWCYDNSSSNCKKYGRLYTWEAAKRACPKGWHLPSDAEWTRLENALGGRTYAGGKLKSTSSKWKSPNEGASNSSGFYALPAGYRYGSDGSFNYMGEYAYFWSSTPNGSKYAWRRSFFYNDGGVYRINGGRANGYSVRCLRN